MCTGLQTVVSHCTIGNFRLAIAWVQPLARLLKGLFPRPGLCSVRTIPQVKQLVTYIQAVVHSQSYSSSPVRTRSCSGPTSKLVNEQCVPNFCTGQQEQEEIKEQDFLRELKQQGVKHAELGSFLDKLGGAIAGKHVSTLDIKVLPQFGNHRATLPNIQYPPLSTFIVAIQKLDAQYCSKISWVTSRAPCPAAC